MTEALLIPVLSNAVAALALAGLVVLVSIAIRRPSVLHILWIAVLLRMVAPVIVPVPLLPDEVSPAVVGPLSGIDVSGGVLLEEPKGLVPSWEGSTLAIWLLGVGIVGGVTYIRVRRMKALVRDAEPAPREIADMADDVAQAFGTSSPPILVTSARVPPLLWAAGKSPVVVLPSSLLSNLSEEQTETLIAHEVAHLARRDHWVRWIEFVVTTVCWWNPLAWMASRQLRRAEEQSCDERVTQVFPNRRRTYAEALITTLRYLSTAKPTRVPAAVGMADLSTVQRRLAEIMKLQNTKPQRTSARWVLAAGIAATLIVSPLLIAETKTADVMDPLAEVVSLELQDAPIRAVLDTFSDVTGFQFVIAGEIHPTVSLSIDKQPVHEALEQITRSNNLAWTLEQGVVIVFRPQDSRSPMVVGTRDGDSVYRFIEGKFEEPVRLSGPPPKYPVEAKSAGVTGVVILDVLIDRTGRVHDPIVKRSKDNNLSQAAIEAVSEWTFEPAQHNGQPVAVRYLVTVNFRLE